MNQILQAAQQMQAHLANAQQNLADAEVTGTAGGGLVVAKVSGQGELLDLTIDPKVIDASDPAECADTIADLVLAAVRDASSSVAALQQRQLGFADVLGNIDLSSLGLPGGIPGGLPGGLPGFPGGLPGLPGFGAPGVGGYAADDDFDDDDFDEDSEDDEDLEGGPEDHGDYEKGKE
jgi:DNA-binding YbaB/EbfC family protein